MRKIIFAIFSALPFLSSAQKISDSRWQDLFSYNNVLAIRKDGERLIAAAENGIFYYHPVSGEISKLSKANGLHDVKISAFDYNNETKTGLIGYENGRLDVITPEGIFLIVDVPLSGGYRGTKRINHISITGNQAAVSIGYQPDQTSAQYAIAIFDLKKREFKESVIMSEPSREAVILNNEVYTVTNKGLKSHEINVTFPLYSSWKNRSTGDFHNIALHNGAVYFAGNDTALHNLGGSSTIFASKIQDILSTNNSLLVATSEGENSWIQNLTENKIEHFEAFSNTGFYLANSLFSGSKTKGILFKENAEKVKEVKPDGPFNNFSYKINLKGDRIWVSTGTREDRYNKAPTILNQLGFYYFDGKKWHYPDLFRKYSVELNVLDAIGNPQNLNETFIANYSNPRESAGVLLIEKDGDDFIIKKHFILNSSAKSYNKRPVGFVVDDNRNLFLTSSYFGTDDGSGYHLLDTKNSFIIGGRQVKSYAAAQKPVINDGFLWYGDPRANEFIAIDLKNTPQNLNDDEVYILKGTTPNLPANAKGGLSIAFDKNGDAWLGTDAGLRILANANTAVKNNPRAEPIIITQNGLGEELFRDSAILQIAVDSGNRKWVSVDGGGVYYLSASGQQTIYHFTKENSPLPDNSVTDIKIDSSGKVYFVSHSGIVSFQGDTANVTENFSDVLVYPNPVIYTQYKGSVHLKGLAEKTNIRITDAAGNLVHQAVARGGTYEWDLTSKGKRVASGIYFVLMTNADGTDKASAKIAVVN